MKMVAEEHREKEYFNHLSTWTRIKLFFTRKKRRFFYLLLIYLTFQYASGVFGFFTARVERSYRKYKKRWIQKYNPHIITYTTALETAYEPEKLSHYSTERLSEAFIKVDRMLKHGVSRQLIINVLSKVRFHHFQLYLLSLAEWKTRKS